MNFKSDKLNPKYKPTYPVGCTVILAGSPYQVIDHDTDSRLIQLHSYAIVGYENVRLATSAEEAVFKSENTKYLPDPPTSLGKGMKFDGDKNRLDLLVMGMPDALEGIAKVLTFGARKYAADSWQHVEDGIRRYEGAAMRHKMARLKGEWLDPESGQPHIYHELCCTMFIAQLHEIQNKEKSPNVQ